MFTEAIFNASKEGGRTLTDSELQALKDRVETAAHDLEAEDPAAWRALPIEERIARGAQLAQLRYMAAMRAEQRRNVARMLSLGAAPVHGASTGSHQPMAHTP